MTSVTRLARLVRDLTRERQSLDYLLSFEILLFVNRELRTAHDRFVQDTRPLKVISLTQSPFCVGQLGAGLEYLRAELVGWCRVPPQALAPSI